MTMLSSQSSNVTDVATSQTNFNPSWMPQKSSFKVEKTDVSNDDEKTCDPIFARYSYGREDLLALNKIDANKKPPPGMENCIFYTGEPQDPMLILPFSEGELKLNNNINSSKAISAYGRTDKSANGGSSDLYVPTPGSGYRGPNFQSRRQNDQSHNHNNNRWSALSATSTAANKPWKNHERGREKTTSTSVDHPPNSSIAADDSESESKHVRHHDNEVDRGLQSTSINLNKDAINKPIEHRTSNDVMKNTEITFSSNLANYKWCYLDPSGMRRGPFESQQMQAWYSSGYFNNGLTLCRDGDSSFVTLGELIAQNGSPNPFTYKMSQQKVAGMHSHGDSSVSMKHGAVTSAAATNSETLVDTHISPKLVDVEKIWSSPLVDESLKDKERQLREEQRKLREKEEILRLEEREREEKERKMREMEQDINRQKEELSRLAREKERELEIKCLQVAEYERKRREELEMLEQKIKIEQMQQELRKAEEDRRRAREMEERIRKEQERQRQLMEAEAKRIREEEESRLRQLSNHEAQRIAALRIDEEKKREELKRMLEEKQQQHNRMLEQQKLRSNQAVESQFAVNLSPISTPPAEKKQGWNVDASQQLVSSVDWTFPHPQPTKSQTINKISPSQPPRTWSQIKAPIPAPIPVQISKTLSSKRAPPSNNKEFKQFEKPKMDQFTLWIVKRVREMNSDVDAEVFASFIEGVDSPNEVEDYIIGYLGDSKTIRDFHREFLNKRIELRPRVKATKKDDLSCPAVAITDILEKNHFFLNKENPNNKKKKKPQKVLDPRTLGFRPSGDPNRINAGEIDITPPAPVTTKKKR